MDTGEYNPWRQCLLYSQTDRYNQSRTQVELKQSHVEAGSNTSTIALRVIGGEEKGSLESETVKYGHQSYGTQTQK
jgi:hypothetical protein